MSTPSLLTRLNGLVKRLWGDIDDETFAASLGAISGFYGAPIIYMPSSWFEEPGDNASAETLQDAIASA